MDEVQAYSCDAFVNGQWKIVHMGVGTKLVAVFASIQFMIGHYPKNTHFHVWQNGMCIFDSHEGEPEPENESECMIDFAAGSNS